MKPNKEELLKNYDPSKHFRVSCFLDNPNLDKLLTGEGADEAKRLYPEYISIDASFDNTNKYKVWEIAAKINNNPDVSFFTCVADRSMNHLHIEFWGSEELLVSARLLGENGDAMLKFMLEDQSNN